MRIQSRSLWFTSCLVLLVSNYGNKAWSQDFLDISNNNEPPPCGFYAGAGIGTMYPNVTNKTTFATSGMPDFPDDQYVTNDWNHPAEYLLMAGYRWQRDPSAEWLTGYSLQLQYSYTNTQFRGLIYVNSLADMQNYTYQYQLKQQLVLLQLKADILNWCELLPYVLIGAGVAYDHVGQYSESPVPGQTVMEKRDHFGSDCSSQFAWAVGAGIDYWLGDDLQVGISYQYAYTGNVTTGNGETVLINDHITNKLYTNSVDLHALYFFNFF